MNHKHNFKVIREDEDKEISQCECGKYQVNC